MCVLMTSIFVMTFNVVSFCQRTMFCKTVWIPVVRVRVVDSIAGAWRYHYWRWELGIFRFQCEFTYKQTYKNAVQVSHTSSYVQSTKLYRYCPFVTWSYCWNKTKNCYSLLFQLICKTTCTCITKRPWICCILSARVTRYFLSTNCL